MNFRSLSKVAFILAWVVAFVAGIYKGMSTSLQTNPLEASITLAENTAGVELKEGEQGFVEFKATSTRLTPVLRFELRAHIPKELCENSEDKTEQLVFQDMERGDVRYTELGIVGKKAGDYVVTISDPSWKPVVEDLQIRVRVLPKSSVAEATFLPPAATP